MLASERVSAYASEPPPGMEVLGVPRHVLTRLCGTDGVRQVVHAAGESATRALTRLGPACDPVQADLRAAGVGVTPERVLTVLAHRNPELLALRSPPGVRRKRRGPLRRLKHALRAVRRLRSENRPPPGPRIWLGQDPVEVHSVVCAPDVRMSLWSLSSFVAFTGLRPRVVIHDDGTLTDGDRETYGRYFDGVEILDARRMDAETARALAPWPTCAAFRARPDFYCARKLFDILFAARAAHLLVLDSDVLFFRRPDRLVERLREGGPCFASDYQSSYGATHSRLEAWRGSPVLTCVNAGLLHVPVAGYRSHLDLVERYLAFAEQALPRGQVNKHEQTAHALLMTELGGERLPPAYQLAGALDERTVSHHFVRDGRQRGRFWYRGVRRIEAEVAKRLRRLADG